MNYWQIHNQTGHADLMIQLLFRRCTLCYNDSVVPSVWRYYFCTITLPRGGGGGWGVTLPPIALQGLFWHFPTLGYVFGVWTASDARNYEIFPPNRVCFWSPDRSGCPVRVRTPELHPPVWNLNECWLMTRHLSMLSWFIGCSTVFACMFSYYHS